MTAVIQEEEYLDHLTPTGELIGPVLRSKAHKEGLWHKVIHLWVINKAGQLLLQKRAACKESFPSMWDLSVGGHMTAGDDAPTSVQREAEEELGLIVTKEELQHVFSTKQQFVLRNGTYIDNELVEVYLIEREVDLSKFVLQESEVEAVKWMDWREVKKVSLDPNSDFVPVHTEYEPFWNYVEQKYPSAS